MKLIADIENSRINFSNYFQLNISQENIMEINLDPVQLGKLYPQNRQIY